MLKKEILYFLEQEKKALQFLEYKKKKYANF